jgi:hypothetical protein
MRVKITVHVPPENADEIRNVLGRAGAGQIGEYSYCSFTTFGIGRSTPSESAKPYIGESGKLEQIEEEKIEVVCDRDKAKEVIRLMKQAHPYEEPAFDITPLIDESEL